MKAKRKNKAHSVVLVFILLVAFLLSSCSQGEDGAGIVSEPSISLPESNISSEAVPSSSNSPSSEAPALTLDIEKEPPQFEKNTAPDFLSEEQQNVYKKALVFQSALLIESLDISKFPYADGQAKPEQEISKDEVLIDNVQYYMVQGRYSRWDDLYAVITSIFTEEYFNERWGERFIFDENGNALVASASRGTNNERTDEPDSFELVQKTEKEIEFNAIGYYKSKDDGTRYTKAVANKMELTENGWRLSRFEITL